MSRLIITMPEDMGLTLNSWSWEDVVVTPIIVGEEKTTAFVVSGKLSLDCSIVSGEDEGFPVGEFISYCGVAIDTNLQVASVKALLNACGIGGLSATRETDTLIPSLDDPVGGVPVTKGVHWESVDDDEKV